MHSRDRPGNGVGERAGEILCLMYPWLGMVSLSMSRRPNELVDDDAAARVGNFPPHMHQRRRLQQICRVAELRAGLLYTVECNSATLNAIIILF